VLRSRATSTSQKKTGSSLSSLLQSRSEAAASKRAGPAASPLSPLPDIDSKDKHNPLAASDYAQDIYCYYRRVEPRFAVAADYMTGQVRAWLRIAMASGHAAAVDRSNAAGQL